MQIWSAKPAASYPRTTINKNGWATHSSIRYVILEKKDHPDLYVAAICKASADPAKPKACGGEEKRYLCHQVLLRNNKESIDFFNHKYKETKSEMEIRKRKRKSNRGGKE